MQIDVSPTTAEGHVHPLTSALEGEDAKQGGQRHRSPVSEEHSSGC